MASEGRMTNELIDTAEAAQILDVTPRWVRDLIERGDLPAQRVGNQWVLTRQDVEDYKQKRAAD